jgi:hypothetical protein
MLLLASLLFAQAVAASPETAPDCEYDRAAMLALDQKSFDQDMTGGWRPLGYKGCYLAAADLIRDWRAAKGGTGVILQWHEGQMRANAGQTEAAIALFEQSRQPAEQDAAFGWNHYVDGTIAFLRGDRAALEAARAKLAAVPRPANFDPIGPDGKPMKVIWPLNLNVLDGFLRCWGRSYTEAYACAGSFSE